MRPRLRCSLHSDGKELIMSETVTQLFRTFLKQRAGIDRTVFLKGTDCEAMIGIVQKKTRMRRAKSSPRWVRVLSPAVLLLASCGPLHTQPGTYCSIATFGAKGDAVIRDDGVAAAGSAAFSSHSSIFSAADKGKFIEITGAGSNASMLHGAGTAYGILATTIESVLDSHTIMLSSVTTASGSNLHFVYGTDNTAAFRTAYESGQPLSLPAGMFLIVAGTQTHPATITGSAPLIMTGAGVDSKLLSDNPIFSLTGNPSGTSITNLDLEPIAKLTVIPVSGKPPHSGTPVLVDIFGTGNGVQPPFNIAPKYPAFWNGLSAFQQTQILGPTITIQGGDHVNISNITGNQVTIMLEDVTSSFLQNNDFIGGYGGNGNEGVGTGIEGCLGIATVASLGQFTNVGDTITGNKVRYCSFSNIYWANADSLVVSNNVSEYSGESGYKNFAGSSTHASHNLSVSNNISRYSVYDGFDLSADYPHKATFPMYATVMGNLSQNNQNTGFFSDGTNWNFTANTASSNGIEGFILDYSDSVISGNVSLNNNLDSLLSPNPNNQFVIGGCCPTSTNDIEDNFINVTIAGILGDAMWVGSSNVTASNNIAQVLPGEGGLWFNIPPVSSSGNTGWPTTFNGNVTINGSLGVTGTVSKGAGSFKIDHPLDPLNKYLVHSFVESPDMMNVYNGVVELDSAGQADVALPAYFEALNDHFRYQLTTIGKFDPVYVAREVKGNSFVIAGGRPGTLVSWQVTGIRKDPYAQTHRIQPEVDKPESERGHYLHPEAYGETPK